jgi:FkbM family methyltransferase
LDPTRNKIYQAVAWDKDGESLIFNVTSKSASSSLFDLGDHKDVYPDIEVIEKVEVKTNRLDSILSSEDSFEFVVLDIQGAEARAIKGLGDRINQVNWIYTEVSKRELYKGSTLFEELEEQLTTLGFKRVFTAWDRKAGWGDALYARKSIYSVTHIQSLKIGSRKFGRYLRSFIPNSAFPHLVRAKRILKRAINDAG